MNPTVCLKSERLRYKCENDSSGGWEKIVALLKSLFGELKTRQMDKPDVSLQLHRLGMEAVGEKAIGFWSESPRAREHLLALYFTHHTIDHTTYPLASGLWLSASHFKATIYYIWV